jgi:hypothetical protein
MSRRRWLVYLRRFRRRARDQLIASLLQLWECVSTFTVRVVWVVIILFILIIINHKLQRIVPREQVHERQLQELELIHHDSCPKDR